MSMSSRYRPSLVMYYLYPFSHVTFSLGKSRSTNARPGQGRSMATDFGFDAPHGFSKLVVILWTKFWQIQLQNVPVMFVHCFPVSHDECNDTASQDVHLKWCREKCWRRVKFLGRFQKSEFCWDTFCSINTWFSGCLCLCVCVASWYNLWTLWIDWFTCSLRVWLCFVYILEGNPNKVQ